MLATTAAANLSASAASGCSLTCGRCYVALAFIHRCGALFSSSSSWLFWEQFASSWLWSREQRRTAAAKQLSPSLAGLLVATSLMIGKPFALSLSAPFEFAALKLQAAPLARARSRRRYSRPLIVRARFGSAAFELLRNSCDPRRPAVGAPLECARATLLVAAAVCRKAIPRTVKLVIPRRRRMRWRPMQDNAKDILMVLGEFMFAHLLCWRRYSGAQGT